MKRILFLAGVAVAGFLLLSAGVGLYLFEHPDALSGATTGEVCLPIPNLAPLPDVDALAARMKYGQDVYQSARDQALTAYAKGHTPHPYDEEAKATLRLFAYLSVWDDYYGEGLWHLLNIHCDNLLREGDKQPLWQTLFDVEQFRIIYYNVDHWDSRYSETEPEGIEFTQEMLDFGHTDYPPLFKFVTYTTAITDLVQAKTASDTGPTLHDKFAPQLSQLTELAAGTYSSFIKAGYANKFLFLKGRTFLDAGKDHENTLNNISGALHRVWANDGDNPVGTALDGEFYVDDAWYARGTGTGDTVTSAGEQLLKQRLAKASQILTDLYAKYPNESMISDIMLRVVLGQGQPRDQMELWFQRGIKADPDDFTIYMRKRWYLLPRWYGSDEDLEQFGLECAKSDNWAAKIPMLLVECLADPANRDHSIYARPEIWDPLAKTYRGYLEHYPQSVYYRGLFAISAVYGQHWDVANEQFAILGDHGDPVAFEDIDYAAMKNLAARHSSH